LENDEANETKGSGEVFRQTHACRSRNTSGVGTACFATIGSFHAFVHGACVWYLYYYLSILFIVYNTIE
jgi:hypothetical protein